jgi:CHAT domain/von Willebrand factor type A domain
MNSSQINVLIVFANPLREKAYLRLDQEEKDIREAIRRSKNSSNIKLETRQAATVQDLQRALLDEDYQIVQISGHGERNGLILENDQGEPYVVPQKALANLFSLYRQENNLLECVILNACYSLKQGTLIASDIPYTIAMEEAIGDKAAIEFITRFYDTIGAGRTIEFAYKMGCSAVELMNLNSILSPKFLIAGETWGGSESEPNYSDRNRSNVVNGDDSPANVLVGVAVDLSGSMIENIRNDSNRQLSRLESFRESLERLGEEAKQVIQKREAQKQKTSIDVFIYGFGLRNVVVCDLLSLVKESNKQFSKETLQNLKRDFRQKIDSKYGQYEGLDDVAKQEWRLGTFVDEITHLAKMRGDAEVSRAITREVRKGLEDKIHCLEHTTLSVEKVIELWKQNDEILSYLGEIIYGDTLMQQALTEVASRFKNELEKRPKNTAPILLVVSDGGSQDNDSLSIAQSLKALGVTIISCFITDADITQPKTLVGNMAETVISSAKLMFDLASPADLESRFARFLLQKGWAIEVNAKLFVQVNHSHVLDEFIHVILSPLEDEEDEWLPIGR